VQIETTTPNESKEIKMSEEILEFYRAGEHYDVVGEEGASLEETAFICICGKGLRNWYNIPITAQKIWAVLSDQELENSYEIRIDEYCSMMRMRFGKRNMYVELYSGFATWVRKHSKEPCMYLAFDYEEIEK